MSKKLRMPKPPVSHNPLIDQQVHESWKEYFIWLTASKRQYLLYYGQPEKLPRKRKKWVKTKALKYYFSNDGKHPAGIELPM